MKIKNYKPQSKANWTGRIDDLNDPDSYRWHQIINFIDLNNINPDFKILHKSFCILGFECDKGIEKNIGRIGAINGPSSIRMEMANLPCNFEETEIYDAGNIVCQNTSLNDAQKSLAEAVSQILNLGMHPILLGGGHEIAFGHYSGIYNHFLSKDQKADIGIINFDAHFDLRPVQNKDHSSGTMFSQIAEVCDKNQCTFHYLPIGIQQYANTKSLFKKADQLGLKYILAKDINNSGLKIAKDIIQDFISDVDQIYTTICSDVISSAFAPGVSAPQPFGLHPEDILQMLKTILKSGKAISFDIAEVSPRFDQDNRTAKLAAIIIYAYIINFQNWNY